MRKLTVFKPRKIFQVPNSNRASIAYHLLSPSLRGAPYLLVERIKLLMMKHLLKHRNQVNKSITTCLCLTNYNNSFRFTTAKASVNSNYLHCELWGCTIWEQTFVTSFYVGVNLEQSNSINLILTVGRSPINWINSTW